MARHLLLIVVLLLSTPTVAAAPARVAICHRLPGEFRFTLIEVAEAALPAHLAHGDGVPGGPIPGWPPPYHFGPGCQFDP